MARREDKQLLLGIKESFPEEGDVCAWPAEMRGSQDAREQGSSGALATSGKSENGKKRQAGSGSLTKESVGIETASVSLSREIGQTSPGC